VLLLLDPSRPEQERELESLYVNFAQVNRLSTKQCMVLALHVELGAGQQQPSWQGGWVGRGGAGATQDSAAGTPPR
jgi:Rab-like protein 5